jgi:hypothetical protein
MKLCVSIPPSFRCCIGSESNHYRVEIGSESNHYRVEIGSESNHYRVEIDAFGRRKGHKNLPVHNRFVIVS